MGALQGLAYMTRALDALRALPKKNRRQIVKKIETLRNNPKPPGCKLVQGMKEGEDQVYRIRSGDYRALYIAKDNPASIVVLDIGHRKDVYRGIM